MNLRTGKDGWPTKGCTKDHSAGSGAKGLLSNMSEGDVDAVIALYADILVVVKGKKGDIQRAACLAAASDFSLPFIIQKSQESPVGVALPKVDVVAWARVLTEAADNPTRKYTGSDYQAMLARHKEDVSSERKAQRDARETNNQNVDADNKVDADAAEAPAT